MTEINNLLLSYLPLTMYMVFLLQLTIKHSNLVNKSDENYFLADRKLHPVAAFLSLIATETSVATIVLFPAVGATSGLVLVWLCLGFIAGRLFVATYYLPKIYAMQSISIYEEICGTSGSAHRILASAYLISKNISGGVRFFMAGYAINQLFNWSISLSILIIALIVAFYSLTGGLRSVVITDQLQGIVIFAGGALFTGYLWLAIPPENFVWPQLVNTNLTYSNPLFAGALFLGGFVLTIGTHGADQDLLQRVLAVNGLAGAKRALFLSGSGATVVIILFLMCGHLLKLYQPQLASHKSPLIEFVMTSDFPLLKGITILIIVAAAMSTLDSAIHSTGAVWKRLLSSEYSGRYFSLISLITLSLTALLFIKLGEKSENFLKLAMGSMNYINGGLIAILTGYIFTPNIIRASGIMTALLSGFVTVIFCEFYFAPSLAWTYTILAASLVSYFSLFVFSLFYKNLLK